MSKHISIADTAKIVRAELKKAFPSVKFSVRSKSYSMGASIDIDWTDGPAVKSVEAIVNQFQGKTFDSQNDLASSIVAQWNGESVRWGSDYVFCHRCYSLEFYARAVEHVAAQVGLPVPAIKQSSFVRKGVTELGEPYVEDWGNPEKDDAAREMTRSYLIDCSSDAPTDRSPSGSVVKVQPDAIAEKFNPDLVKAQKFRSLAEGMQQAIDSKLTDRLANTHRRARMAASAIRDGEQLQRIRSVLLALADGWDRGDVDPALRSISTKSQLAWLMPKAVLYNASEDEARSLGYERWSIWTDELLQKQCFPIDQSHESGKILSQLKISTLESLQVVLMALKTILNPPTDSERRHRRIKDLERKLIGCQIPGYFPTPPEIVDSLIDLAEIRSGMTVLEPSAGKGNIADRLIDIAEVTVSCIEPQQRLREILELKGHTCIDRDFLDYADRAPQFFDRIIMNPPFDADIEHVQAAYQCLNPGGRLVAIMSEGGFFRSDRRCSAFRDWLAAVGGDSEKLPDGSFKNSERSTGVACRVVTIDKPECDRQSLSPVVDVLREVIHVMQPRQLTLF